MFPVIFFNLYEKIELYNRDGDNILVGCMGYYVSGFLSF